MSSGQVYLNGRIVSADEAKVAAFDAGLTWGAGLFETFRAYGGRVFRLDAHLSRLAASAAALKLNVPSDLQWVAAAVRDVLEANRLRDARLRLTLTSSRPGDTPDADAAPGTVLLTAAAAAGYAPELYKRGMTVCVSSYRQPAADAVTGHKTLAYLPRLMGLREAQHKHCGEALWFTEARRLAEGCISNVFLVHDGRLATPPLSTPVLPGITRGVVLELAAAAGLACEERELIIDDLLNAQEVFLTNAVMEIMPVTCIERHAVGDERPGPLTRRLRTSYAEVVRAETT